MAIPVSGTYWDGAATQSSVDGIFTLSVNTFIGAPPAGAVCQFFCSGKIAGSSFPIQCITLDNTDPTSGKVTFQGDTALFLKTEENPGCSPRIGDFESEGETLTLETRAPMIQVRIIKADKAFFHSEPKAGKKRKAYLLRGDEARVVEKSGDWLKVTFKKTTGWMQEADMFPLLTP